MTTVVLIAGLAADRRMWESQLQALSPYWPTVVATGHEREHSITAMAQVVLDRHAGSLVLCGASMGGIVALEAIRLAPQRIRALALLGTVAHPETPEMHALRSAAIDLFAQGRAEEVIRANVAMAFEHTHAEDNALTQRYLDMVLSAGADLLTAQNRAVMARPDARTHLAQVACPTLVLCGEDDALTPPLHSRQIADAVPRAELRLIPRCGHMLTLEQPQQVNAALLQWLQRLPV